MLVNVDKHQELDPEQVALMQMQVHEMYPDFVRTMFTKSKGTRWLPKETAIKSPWVQGHLNDRHFVMIDFDGLGSDWWEQLPVKPNVVSFNPENGNHQCFWLLAGKVHCDKAKGQANAPYKYLRRLEKALDKKYKGDTHFARMQHKNLLHPKWETHWLHDRTFTLRELHKGLEVDLRTVGWAEKTLATSIAGTKAKKKGQGKRNTLIFDGVRYRAYKEVEKYKEMGIEYADWHAMVSQWCFRANRFADTEPLRDSEVNATAKSISNWCWNVYNPPKKEKKVHMSESEKRKAFQEGQKITKAKQVERSEKAIREAIASLRADGKKATKVAVSKLTGLGRTQVSTKYKHLFEE